MMHWLARQWHVWWCFWFHDRWAEPANWRGQFVCAKPNCGARRLGAA